MDELAIGIDSITTNQEIHMKHLLLTTCLLWASISVLPGQAITNIKTELTETEYGNARLIIRPSVWDMKAPKPTKSYEVYAALVCYTYKGKQMALHQDLTYDFEKDGFSEEFLAMGATRGNIVIGDILFYRRDEVPASERPKKADCFKK